MTPRDGRDPKKFTEQFGIGTTESNSFQIQRETPATESSSVSPTPETEQTLETKEQKVILPEVKNENIESAIKTLTGKLKMNKKKKTVIPTVKDEFTLRVEKIMEEGLGDAYKELTTVQKQEFKIKGEETAWKIRELFKKTHVKVKEVFRLLVEWLRILPGVNKFFIEQEAKIKADKILTLKKHQNFE